MLEKGGEEGVSEGKGTEGKNGFAPPGATLKLDSRGGKGKRTKGDTRHMRKNKKTKNGVISKREKKTGGPLRKEGIPLACPREENYFSAHHGEKIPLPRRKKATRRTKKPAMTLPRRTGCTHLPKEIIVRSATNGKDGYLFGGGGKKLPRGKKENQLWGFGRNCENRKKGDRRGKGKLLGAPRGKALHNLGEKKKRGRGGAKKTTFFP